MPKTKISEFSATPASNTDIDSINIAEGCAPSGINDAIRELMAQLKDWQSGTSNDPYVVGSSGSLTLNQGTANGVAYLNGSKVVTSGSALTFDGTQMGVNIGPTSNVTLDIKQPTAGQDLIIGLSAGTGARAQLRSIAQADSTSSVFAFYTTVGSSTNEQMRLTSTGLGIGTSSPAAKLDIVGSSSNQIRVGTATSEHYRIGRNASDGFLDFYGSQTGYQGYRFGGIDGTWATINSSGNLGLGVIPSAWGSSFKALQVSSSALINNGANDTFLGANYYYDGSNNRYINSNPASTYGQVDGAHQWYTAASGTAGNAITFTQAMTLDASGNLNVGRTTTVNNARFMSAGSSVAYGTEWGDTKYMSQMYFNSEYYVGVMANAANRELRLESNSGDALARITFYTGASGTTSERARIDSSGNFMIGATASSNKLLVSGTGTIGNFSASGLASSATVQIQAANGTGYNARLYFECPGSNSGGLTYTRADGRLYAYSQTDQSGPYVSPNGTSWTTNSDRRLKTNIEDIGYGLASVMALAPKKYNYISNTEKQCLGLIAQDVANVIPEIVDVPENSESMMGIEYQSLVPVLVKAIQEQQAIIESLKARLDAANL